MIVDQTGCITGSLYMVGNSLIPVFLLDGARPVVVDAGFYWMGETYVRELRRVLRNRQPAWCVLTHSHFDHCGSVAVLKSCFPGMKIAASENAARTLARPNARRLIQRLTEASREMGIQNGWIRNGNHEFQPFEVELVLSPGDELEIDRDLTLHVVDTPGHTRDCLSYYVPEKRILFSSEAAGILDQTGYIVSDCLADYDLYRSSLRRLAEYPVDWLCLGHRYVLGGREAREYLRRSLRYCELFRDWVDRVMQEEQGEIARAVSRIKYLEYDSKPEPRLPEQAYTINLEARIRAVLGRKERFGES